jgi:hypothetical protein
MKLTAPAWRYLGSAASWLLFTFCFTLLSIGASVVMGLGGFCASGGAYVIETECPDTVAWSMPVSIFGGLAAVGIGLLVARGFGAPVVSWAWPVLFIGLGLVFLGSGLAFGGEGIVFDLLALMFVVMGAVPLVLELRANPQAFVLGRDNARSETFVTRETGRKSIYGTWPVSEERPTPRAGDWAASLGILLVFGALGVYLGTLIY